jgi:glycosyltransferase involved in cell wall biosynthesis
MLTRWTDAFVAVADAHGRHLVDHERFPEDKVHIIYNGVDAARFAPHDGTETRRSLGIPLEAPVVGILAALRPEKNHELFLAGAQHILRRLPSARFIIVGDGPKRAELEGLASQLGVASSIHFLGTRSDVPDLLAACDLVALTSHNEAAPVSVLEALSVGKPVVASDVGSVRETVRDGETGRLFPASDVEAYATAAADLLSDRDARERMGAAGRRLVVQRWSLDAMVRGYENLIQGIYDAKRRPAAEVVPAMELGFGGEQELQSPA